MPFRTVLCLFAAAGMLLAAGGQTSSSGASGQAPAPPTTEKNDFVNPNPGNMLKPRAGALPDLVKPGDEPFTMIEPKGLPPEETAELLSGMAKQCSIPLKWAKVQKSAPDPRSEKWIGPNPSRIDPIYAAPPAPVCVDAEIKPSAKPGKPSK